MSDDLTTNPGSGGSTLRSLSDGTRSWPVAVMSYATTLSPGANVLQPVTPGTPMPVDLRGSIALAMAREADFWPSYGGTTATGNATLAVDPGGALVTRGAVTTDEGTFRVNFANTSLAVSLGTVTVSGRTVTGTSFISGSTRDVHLQDYFKLDADGESAWVQIESIDSDTQLTLVASYVGGSSGAASRALIRPQTGAGGSISVASGQCTLTSGTTTGETTRLFRAVDYAPLVARSAFSVSQRIANQAILFGLCEQNTTADRWFARFRLDGTTNTTVICESGRNPTTTPSVAETQSTTVTLPNAATTATSNEYRVEMLTERAIFYVNGVRVAEHARSIPSQHDEMEVDLRLVNGTAPASSTTVVCDYITGKNHNKLEVGIMSDSEQIVTQQPDVVPYSYNVAGVIAINTVLLEIDCSRLRSLSIQCSSIGTAGVVTPEWLNEGTWNAATINTLAGAAATTFNAAGMWTTPVFGRRFRLRLSTATTAGTTTLSVIGYAQGAGYLPTQPVSGTVTATGVAGAAAEDAAASGNPVMAAGVARTANAPTTFVAGDVVRHTMTSGGALVVKQYAPQQVEFSPSLALTTTTATPIAAAAAAGIRNHLTSLWAINTGAAVVDLIILDGVTERARYPLPINVPVPVTFPTGLVTTAATALNANLSAAGTVRANFTGYTSA